MKIQYPLRVLITGTFESGKTTLISQFKDDPNFVVVPEVARDLLKTDPQLELKSEFQQMVFDGQVRSEQEAMDQAINNGAKFVLCDRGTIDVLAFSDVLGYGQSSDWKQASQNRYDMVFILSRDGIPLHPEVHVINVDLDLYRDNIDKSIHSLAYIHSQRVVELTGSIPERTSLLRRSLSAFAASVEGATRRKEEGVYYKT